MSAVSQPVSILSDLDVIIVGAGFGGMCTLYQLRSIGLSVRVFERGSGVGGTWYWNRYPGARCDVPSPEYSYSFSPELEQEWNWSEHYATQAEILRYAEYVADRFELKRDIQFDTSVVAAVFDSLTNRWTVTLDNGATATAQFLVMAVGCLSSTNVPQIEGLEDFRGEIYHTGNWPHASVDFHDKSVAVIGTGSSGIQLIPEVSAQATELTVFQRTPQYSIPARNRPLPPEDLDRIKADYRGLRARNKLTVTGFGSYWEYSSVSVLDATPEERRQAFESRWQDGGLTFMLAFSDLSANLENNRYAAEFVRSKIREIVSDPETAAKLSPTTALGCKRLCMDTQYFETFNRANVHLVDIADEPIEYFHETGLRAGGRDYPLDMVVFATGYDAMTGSLLAVDVVGRDGIRLRDVWSAGPLTYLGLGVPGIPNFFPIAGPGSPSVLANVIAAIEQHAEWVRDCILYMRGRRLTRIEAKAEAAQSWVEHVNAIANQTLYPSCNSWYLGANIPGKPRVFMPVLGMAAYDAKCQQVAADRYEGFVLSA
jgi:cation diffusion facilitator CzcD-associated flavoprotein CzcO